MGRLTVDRLAVLFEGRTRFVTRLADYDDPLRHARAVLRSLPEADVVEALNAHPRIGTRPLSARSAAEQGQENDPAVLEELARLNRAYEEKFGFRFVVFVNRRPRSQILAVLRERYARTREEELVTAREELVAIAEDRLRTSLRSP
ncbi:MAG TPA: 2-oxo-4-hydroxy-4-carboxy-5-ureidoimidazoline decarboxylase [bacterium]|nr:2-oxo-4-hydroxy-4-carboxy-5-ureidoimidazoline decarboxylase [bacterium]